MPDESKPTILIVDDEELIRKSLVRLLRPLDVDITVATDGEDGLVKLKERLPAVIVSDQRMPRLTGVEFLAKSREFSPDSVRILLTGYADIEASISAINSGAVKYYFTKPWDDDMVLSRIKESLDLYRVMTENRRLQQLTEEQNHKLRRLNTTLHQQVQEQTREIRKQNEELKQSFMETIKAFSTIIEMRSQEIGSHSQRVAGLTKHMIGGMSLSDKEVQDIVVAAFVHDIGKIALPDRLANRNFASMTPADQDRVRQHPIIGQSFVCTIAGFEEIGQIVRHHHENYDGTGYPDNLRDKTIPLGARAIRLVNEFDHLAFVDEYPDLSTLNRAAAYVVEHSGSKFDPQMVRRFIDLDVAHLLYHGEMTEIMGVKPEDLQESMVVAHDIKTRSGLFLLPKGATLSTGMIGRIRKIHAVDPVAEVVRVYKNMRTEKEPVAAF